MTRAIKRVLLLCLIASLVLFAVVVVVAAPFPYSLNHSEPLFADQARRLMAGEAIYKTALDEPPYMTANWPPIYPLLVAGAGVVLPVPLLQVGRVISILSAVVSGLVVGLFGTRLTGSRLGGLLAAVLFLAHPFVLSWSPLARVDLLALAFSLLALWFLYTRWTSWPWLLVSLACLVASIYTRQSYALAVPAAGAIWLWTNDRRRAVVFVAGLAFTCLLFFWMLNWATGGGFYLHVISANLGTYLPGRLLTWANALLVLWPIALALAALGVVLALRARVTARGERESQEDGLWGQPFLLFGLLPYTIGACLAALTAGKLGSDVNYFLEAVAALSIWVALVVAWLPGQKPLLRNAILLLVMLQVVWVLAIDGMTQSRRISIWSDLPDYDRLLEQVEAASKEGIVLSSELSLVIRAGQPIYYDPFGYEQARRAGLWDPSELVHEIEAQQFPMILLENPESILHQQGWPPQVTAAIQENYEGTEEMPGLIVYRPRPER